MTLMETRSGHPQCRELIRSMMPAKLHAWVRGSTPTEREFFIDNLLVRIYLNIEMILVDRPCAMGV